MSTSGRILPLTQLCVRQFSRSAAQQSTAEVKEVPSKAFYRLKEKQKKFALEDGTPVFLKNGLVDRVLYLVTSGLVVGAFGWSLETMYTVATK